jgi:acetolactate synthase-1/2/3 large subunit
MGGDESNLRTGGRILVDCLKVHGVDMAFCVPGESYLPVLDALYDTPEIDLVVCRQEGGAAMMADAYGRLTGRPGVCFVTRGPGATNAAAGVHVAFQDSTPLVLFIGQVGREALDREAFQEVDFRLMFQPLAKWAAEIQRADRIPEYVSRAFHAAASGRPGPVVLSLPEDVLYERAAATMTGRYREIQPAPAPEDMAKLRAMLAAAKRPIVVLGGRGWDQQAWEDMQAFAEANALPVVASYRCQDRFDNGHPCYAGDIGIGPNPRLKQRIADCDLLLAVGARLGEVTTDRYTTLTPPRTRQPLVHVYPGVEELGRVFQPDLPIAAGMKTFAAAARALPPVNAAWAGWTKEARADYLAWIEPPRVPGDLQMGEIMAWLRKRLPEDAIVCNGAGNYTVWIHRFHQHRRFLTQLAPTSGSMGYGTPAAVAAKRLFPERVVVAFAGDGCFLMNGQELATAVQYGLDIVILVVNNGMYGTIRMNQEMEYPGRVKGSELRNPDFALLARAYGAHGETVKRTEEFEPAFERALAAGKPALLDLHLHPEAITTTRTLTEIREQALAAKG